MIKKRTRLTMERRAALEGLFFVSPFIIGLCVFFIYPLIRSLRLSFGKVTNPVGYVIEGWNFDNYIRAFTLDLEFIPFFVQIIQEALIRIPLIIIFSLLIAMMINRKIAFRGFFRVVFFIPFLLGTGEVMKQLLNQRVDLTVLSVTDGSLIPYDVLNYFGGNVVTAVQGFLGNLVTILWRSGVQILLFLSGLQGISPSLYEAAKIDGSTEWEMFWKVTLPLISPIMLLCSVYTVVNSFVDINNPMFQHIQYNFFRDGRPEYAAAMSWIYFSFILLLVGLVFLALKAYIRNNQQ